MVGSRRQSLVVPSAPQVKCITSRSRYSSISATQELSVAPIRPSQSIGTTLVPRCSPPLMSHEARQRLIRQPFQTQRIPGKSWAGVLISDAVPMSGHRMFDASYTEDESYIRYGRRDDEV